VIGLDAAIAHGHSATGAYLAIAAEAATMLRSCVMSMIVSILFLREADAEALNVDGGSRESMYRERRLHTFSSVIGLWPAL